MSRRPRTFLRVSVDVSHKPLFFEVVSPRHFPRDSFQLRNISRKGFFLTGDCAIAMETIFQFEMQLSADNLPITGEAIVKWVRPTGATVPGEMGFGAELVKLDAASEKAFHRYIEDCMLELKAIDLATDEKLTISPTDTVEHAVVLMRRGDLGAVVIVGPGNDILGILTEKDIVETVGRGNFSEETVASFMTSSVVTVEATDRAELVYELFRTNSFRHLPVKRDGQFAGLLALRDLLPYWAEAMDLYSRRITMDHERAMSLIVHDLRSPISTIQSANQLLVDDPEQAAAYMAADFPNMVQGNCEKMLTIIDELLEVSRMKVGAIQIKLEPVRLNVLMKTAFQSFAPMAKKKGIKLTSSIPEIIPAVSADPLKISQILDNLISNALKFSPKGATVHLSLEVVAGSVLMKITDSGQGIPPQEMGKLFKEFSKLSPRPTGGERSTGLGLAITKKLVEAHGGKIEVDSTEGKGTTFAVVLPSAA